MQKILSKSNREMRKNIEYLREELSKRKKENQDLMEIMNRVLYGKLNENIKI